MEDEEGLGNLKKPESAGGRSQARHAAGDAKRAAGKTGHRCRGFSFSMDKNV
jgi:hypothetical protein